MKIFRVEEKMKPNNVCEDVFVEQFMEDMRLAYQDKKNKRTFALEYNKWSKGYMNKFITFSNCLQDSYSLIKPTNLQCFCATLLVIFYALEGIRCGNYRIGMASQIFNFFIFLMSFVTAIIVTTSSNLDRSIEDATYYCVQINDLLDKLEIKLILACEKFNLNYGSCPLGKGSTHGEEIMLPKWKFCIALLTRLCSSWYKVYGLLFAVKLSLIMHAFDLEGYFSILDIIACILLLFVALYQDFKILKACKKIKTEKRFLTTIANKFFHWFEVDCDIKNKINLQDSNKEMFLKIMQRNYKSPHSESSKSLLIYVTTLITVGNGLQENVYCKNVNQILKFLFFSETSFQDSVIHLAKGSSNKKVKLIIRNKSKLPRFKNKPMSIIRLPITNDVNLSVYFENQNTFTDDSVINEDIELEKNDICTGSFVKETVGENLERESNEVLNLSDSELSEEGDIGIEKHTDIDKEALERNKANEVAETEREVSEIKTETTDISNQSFNAKPRKNSYENQNTESYDHDESLNKENYKDTTLLQSGFPTKFELETLHNENLNLPPSKMKESNLLVRPQGKSEKDNSYIESGMETFEERVENNSQSKDTQDLIMNNGTGLNMDQNKTMSDETFDRALNFSPLEKEELNLHSNLQTTSEENSLTRNGIRNSEEGSSPSSSHNSDMKKDLQSENKTEDVDEIDLTNLNAFPKNKAQLRTSHDKAINSSSTEIEKLNSSASPHITSEENSLTRNGIRNSEEGSSPSSSHNSDMKKDLQSANKTEDVDEIDLTNLNAFPKNKAQLRTSHDKAINSSSTEIEKLNSSASPHITSEENSLTRNGIRNSEEGSSPSSSHNSDTQKDLQSANKTEDVNETELRNLNAFPKNKPQLGTSHDKDINSSTETEELNSSASPHITSEENSLTRNGIRNSEEGSSPSSSHSSDMKKDLQSANKTEDVDETDFTNLNDCPESKTQLETSHDKVINSSSTEIEKLNSSASPHITSEENSLTRNGIRNSEEGSSPSSSHSSDMKKDLQSANKTEDVDETDFTNLNDCPESKTQLETSHDKVINSSSTEIEKLNSSASPHITSEENSLTRNGIRNSEEGSSPSSSHNSDMKKDLQSANKTEDVDEIDLTNLNAFPKNKAQLRTSHDKAINSSSTKIEKLNSSTSPLITSEENSLTRNGIRNSEEGSSPSSSHNSDMKKDLQSVNKTEDVDEIDLTNLNAFHKNKAQLRTSHDKAINSSSTEIEKLNSSASPHITSEENSLTRNGIRNSEEGSSPSSSHNSDMKKDLQSANKTEDVDEIDLTNLNAFPKNKAQLRTSHDKAINSSSTEIEKLNSSASPHITSEENSLTRNGIRNSEEGSSPSSSHNSDMKKDLQSANKTEDVDEIDLTNLNAFPKNKAQLRTSHDKAINSSSTEIEKLNSSASPHITSEENSLTRNGIRNSEEGSSPSSSHNSDTQKDLQSANKTEDVNETELRNLNAFPKNKPQLGTSHDKDINSSSTETEELNSSASPHITSEENSLTRNGIRNSEEGSSPSSSHSSDMKKDLQSANKTEDVDETDFTNLNDCPESKTQLETSHDKVINSSSTEIEKLNSSASPHITSEENSLTRNGIRNSEEGSSPSSSHSSDMKKDLQSANKTEDVDETDFTNLNDCPESKTQLETSHDKVINSFSTETEEFNSSARLPVKDLNSSASKNLISTSPKSNTQDLFSCTELATEKENSPIKNNVENSELDCRTLTNHSEIENGENLREKCAVGISLCHNRPSTAIKNFESSCLEDCKLEKFPSSKNLICSESSKGVSVRQYNFSYNSSDEEENKTVPKNTNSYRDSNSGYLSDDSSSSNQDEEEEERTCPVIGWNSDLLRNTVTTATLVVDMSHKVAPVNDTRKDFGYSLTFNNLDVKLRRDFPSVTIELNHDESNDADETIDGTVVKEVNNSTPKNPSLCHASSSITSKESRELHDGPSINENTRPNMIVWKHRRGLSFTSNYEGRGTSHISQAPCSHINETFQETETNEVNDDKIKEEDRAEENFDICQGLSSLSISETDKRFTVGLENSIIFETKDMQFCYKPDSQSGKVKLDYEQNFTDSRLTFKSKSKDLLVKIG